MSETQRTVPDSGAIPKTSIAYQSKIIIFLWGAAVITCFAVLANYGQRPGEVGVPCSAQDAGIELVSEHYTLVMAIHPKCPCSSASMYELERLIQRCSSPVDCVFVVYESAIQPSNWYEDELSSIQPRFPNAQVIRDPGGDLSRQLGAVTSGSTVLYDPSGSAVFWGGITSSRAHAGDNLGSDSIRAIVDGEQPVRNQTLVYGCPITELSSHALLGSCSIEEHELVQTTSEEPDL